MAVKKRGRKYTVMYRDPDTGKPSRASFDTATEAWEFNNDLTLRRQGLKRVPFKVPKSFAPTIPTQATGPTVAEYTASIIETADVKPTSLDAYRHAVDIVNGSPLGRERLQGNPNLVQAVRSFFGDKELHNRRMLRSVLAMAFNAAVRENLILKSPIEVAKIKVPTARKKRVKVLNAEEVRVLIAAAYGYSEEDGLAVTIAALTGMRGGEVGGIHVEDIDPHTHELTIRHNITAAKGRARGDGSPKSGHERTITVNGLADELLAYAKRQGRKPEDYLLLTTQRNPWRAANVTAAVKRALENGGLTNKITGHDLRHTFVSLAVRAGKPLSDIGDYLGQSSKAITEMYRHIYGDESAAVADAVQALVGGPVPLAIPAGKDGAR